MADVNVAAGAIGTPILTLVAATVQAVNFAEDLSDVEVVSDGAAVVWWTCDGTTPAAGVGYYIPAVAGVDKRWPKTGGATMVKLYSPGTPTVRVQRGD